MNALTVSRLRVVADADPGAIARVIERFSNLNVMPRRILAEFGTHDTLHIQVDVCGLSAAQLQLISSKLCQSPSIVNAYWHPV